MKKGSYESNPLATLGAIVTLVIIGISAKHCMRKYGRETKKNTKIKL